MKQIIKANLVNKPESMTSKQGKPYVKFTVAENRYKKNEDGSFEQLKKANFYDVYAYGEYAIKAALTLSAKDFVQLSGIAVKGTKKTMFRMADAKLLKKYAEKKAA